MERRCQVCGRELNFGEACYHDEKVKMTPAPWIAVSSGEHTRKMFHIMIASKDKKHFIATVRPIMRSEDIGAEAIAQCETDATAIVSAVNNTYGKGIRPEAVHGLLTAPKNILVDVEPMKGGETVCIPSVSVKLIKAALEKAKFKQ